MKAKEVLKLLHVTRVTLCKYVKSGKIKVRKMSNGYYDYDEESVDNLIGRNGRRNIIYARVSTCKQKVDLKNQVETLKNYCSSNAIEYFDIFSEIASGLNLDRKMFSKLLNLVVSYKVKTVYITNKDRLTRLSFKVFQTIFHKFGTDIVVINYNNESDSEDVFEELVSLVHMFSTKMYSNRRRKIKH